MFNEELHKIKTCSNKVALFQTHFQQKNRSTDAFSSFVFWLNDGSTEGQATLVCVNVFAATSEECRVFGRLLYSFICSVFVYECKSRGH